MTLRILYAVHGYKPAYQIGGPIHSVSALAERMVQRGHEVTVFTSNSNLTEDLDVPTDQPIDVEGVKVWYFRREEPLQRWLPFVPYLSKSIGFLYAARMRAELDRLVPAIDIVHTHMPFVYPTVAAGRAAKRHRKPLFYHQRGVFDPERLRFRGAKKRLYIAAIERPLMRSAARLVALTDAERRSYRALGVQSPCVVIPNGISINEYRAHPVAAQPAGLALDADAQVILFMSRMHPTKGYHVLFDAFVALASEFPKAILVMAGPDEWGNTDELRRQAAALGLAERIFLPGMVAGDAKCDLLARADVFCLPSDAEGFSMAVLEAMASSTAVILSPGCHFDEVEPAGAGVVAAADVVSQRAALAECLSDPGRLATMGRRSRQFVAENYTWDAITDRMLAEYTSVHDGWTRAAQR